VPSGAVRKTSRVRVIGVSEVDHHVEVQDRTAGREGSGPRSSLDWFGIARFTLRLGNVAVNDVVVRVGDGDVRRINPVEIGVGAGGGAKHDRVADVPIHDGVIDARDRDRLGDVPVGGSEDYYGFRGVALGRITRADGDGDVRGRGIVEADREAGRATCFGRDQPRGRGDDGLGTRGRGRVASRDRPVDQGACDEEFVILGLELPGAGEGSCPRAPSGSPRACTCP